MKNEKSMKPLTPILCRNRTSFIDPLKYPCDIGRIADALLLFEKTTIVTDSFHEVIGLLGWMGNSLFIELIRDQSISFTLVQTPPQPFVFNGGEYSIGRMSAGTHLFRDPSDPVIRNTAELRHYLISLFKDAEYLPPDWHYSEEVIDAIVSATNIMPETFPDECIPFLHLVLSENTILKKVELEFQSRWGADCSIVGRLKKLKEGYVFDTPSDKDFMFFSELVSGAYEIAISSVVSGRSIASWLGSNIIDSSLNMYVGNTGSRESLLRTIYHIEELPRLENAVFLDEIPASEVVKLRNTRAAVKFRNWMTSAEEVNHGDLLKAYMRELAACAKQQSILFSAMRLIGVTAIGLINTPIGAGIGALDWIVDKFRGRLGWNPKVFVDDALSSTLSQCSAAKRLRIPIDPITLLNNRWRVKEFRYTSAGTQLNFHRGEAESFNIGYSSDGRDLAMLNRRIDDIIVSSDCDLFFECNVCRRINRLPGGKRVEAVRCSACKSPLFPMVLTGK